MDYTQTSPAHQNPPPAYGPLAAGDSLHPPPPPPPLHPPPPQWHHPGALLPHQQPLSYPPNTTNPNPNPNFCHNQYNSTQSSPTAQELTPHSADGGEDQRMIAAKEAIRQYGAQPVGYAAAPPRADCDGLEHSTPYQNLRKPPICRKFKKNIFKKTPKVVQSGYCEVCKVDCNSQDVLKSHNEGKKHNKKLKQLQDSISREAAKALASEPYGTRESTADQDEKLDTNRKRAAITEIEVDLETKRSRILEAGAYFDEVRVCTICNVVVNSQKVYEYHLEGQKHAAMVAKLQETEFSW